MIAALKVAVPFAVEGVSLAFDLEMTLCFDRLLNADELFTGVGIGKAPGSPLAMGKIAFGDPAPGLIRVTVFGPSIQPAPDVAVEPTECLATDDMAVIIRPASEYGVEPIDELFGRGARGLLTKGLDLGFHGLQTGLAGGDLKLGRLAMRPGIFTDRLP